MSHKHFLGALTSLGKATGVEQRAFENAEMRTLLLCEHQDAEQQPHQPKLAGSKVVPTGDTKRRDEL